MLSKYEIEKWILENCMNEEGIIDLSGLDFKNKAKGVNISHMKVTGNLEQEFQVVLEGNLVQARQIVLNGNLEQNQQHVNGNIYQSVNIASGYINQCHHQAIGNIIQDYQISYGNIVQDHQVAFGKIFQDKKINPKSDKEKVRNGSPFYFGEYSKDDITRILEHENTRYNCNSEDCEDYEDIFE